MADDDRLEVKVGRPDEGPAVPHAPGTTFQPAANPEPSPSPPVAPEPVQPQPLEVPLPSVSTAPPPRPAPPVQPTPEPVAEHRSPIAAVVAGPQSSHVVSHPHKQSLGKGFARELVYVALLLLIVVICALAAIYFLKI